MSEYDKVDPVSGRRYREFGNCREYAPDLVHSSGKPEPAKAKQGLEEKRCPFRSMVNDRCAREQCAFYIGTGCTLANTDRKPARDTSGLRCPLNRERRVCDAKCALYRQGCLITALERS